MHKLTPAQFNQFVTAVAEAQNELCVRDWTLTAITFDAALTDKNAEIEYNVSSRKYRILVGPEWELEPTPSNLRHVAFHELLHLVMAEMYTLAHSRLSAAEVEQYGEFEHTVIAKLTQRLAPLHANLVGPQTEPMPEGSVPRVMEGLHTPQYVPTAAAAPVSLPVRPGDLAPPGLSF